MKANNLLCQLDVVAKVTWVAQVGQHIDDVLLLGEELLGEGLPTLLALLLGSKLDHLGTLLARLLSRSLALASRRLASSLSLHRRRGLSRWAIVLVHALHVVKEVVATGEAVARHSSLTVPEVAQVWTSTVAVHTVRLALVAEKACSRRELHTNARLLVAAERLEVRVDVLAAKELEYTTHSSVTLSLTRSCT